MSSQPSHGLVLPFEGTTPEVPDSSRIMYGASVIGDVVLGDDVSIWFGAIVRGDVEPIRIGARSNIQDNAVVHVTDGSFSTTIGENVTVGHRAMIHGCTIGDHCLIGMGSTILDGAVLEDQVFLGAGSLVTAGTVLPSGYLCFGRPAKAIRPLDDALKLWVQYSAQHYVELAKRYGDHGLISS